MRKLMMGIAAAVCAGMLMGGTAMAEELLPGGGSNILYCITPYTSKPFSGTEQIIAEKDGPEL